MLKSSRRHIQAIRKKFELLYGTFVTTPPVPPGPPEYDESEVGDVSPEDIMVAFTKDVTSPTADYLSGVTIRINAIVEAFETAARQADHSYVLYGNSTDFSDANDVVTWEYDDAFGDIAAEDGGGDLLDVLSQTVDNRVGMHLYFDNDEELVWISAI